MRLRRKESKKSRRKKGNRAATCYRKMFYGERKAYRGKVMHEGGGKRDTEKEALRRKRKDRKNSRTKNGNRTEACLRKMIYGKRKAERGKSNIRRREGKRRETEKEALRGKRKEGK